MAVLGFLKLSLIIMFLAHWIACLWHAIGEQNETNNWMITHGIYDKSW
jgi:hyperpolarization activated cyclic nucleotide-gated potassium channel 2